jgi:DNA-binding Xre family transcriptional regulator
VNRGGAGFSPLETICAALDCSPGDLLRFRRDDRQEIETAVGE